MEHKSHCELFDLRSIAIRGVRLLISAVIFHLINTVLVLIRLFRDSCERCDDSHILAGVFSVSCQPYFHREFQETNDLVERSGPRRTCGKLKSLWVFLQNEFPKRFDEQIHCVHEFFLLICRAVFFHVQTSYQVALSIASMFRFCSLSSRNDLAMFHNTHSSRCLPIRRMALRAYTRLGELSGPPRVFARYTTKLFESKLRNVFWNCEWNVNHFHNSSLIAQPL